MAEGSLHASQELEALCRNVELLEGRAASLTAAATALWVGSRCLQLPRGTTTLGGACGTDHSWPIWRARVASHSKFFTGYGT